MKKLALIAAGLMISGAASAVTLVGSDEVLMTDCELLNEDVTINLTNGVEGGVSCNTAAIALTVCHTAGKSVNRTVGKRDVAASGNVPAHQVDCTISSTDNTCVATEVDGSAMPSASTNRGTVSAEYPGTTCSAANAETEAATLLPAAS
ncbi:hypothetical protein I0D00_18430 [Pseudomonas lalucatii]|uniref:Uncharacterized protein n=1 Tax=Pseudomonas lalucatii TaxID=1424203 RepID=A0ABS5Q564_9PSED|nr:hypothetical protein [Pseudomonas lalucatii]MBS7663908.1 hypothetical protein [Pseudomonas lalucatii]